MSDELDKQKSINETLLARLAESYQGIARLEARLRALEEPDDCRTSS